MHVKDATAVSCAATLVPLLSSISTLLSLALSTAADTTVFAHAMVMQMQLFALLLQCCSAQASTALAQACGLQSCMTSLPLQHSWL
jgi:hypothetical protein